MNLDMTITLGNLITIVLVAVGALGSWAGIKQLIALLMLRMKNVEENVDKIEHDIDNIATIMRDQAVQSQQIIHLQRQIDELKHGEGFIFPLKHATGEVPPRR